MRCYKCGWEGPDDKMVEEKGGLHFYDYVTSQTFQTEISRWNYKCPSCGETLKSVKRMGADSTSPEI